MEQQIETVGDQLTELRYKIVEGKVSIARKSINVTQENLNKMTNNYFLLFERYCELIGMSVATRGSDFTLFNTPEKRRNEVLQMEQQLRQMGLFAKFKEQL